MNPVRPAPLWLRVGAGVARQLPVGRYRAASWLAMHATVPFLARLPSRLGGSWFRCDPRDGSQSHAYFAGVYEPQETAVVQALLSPGDTFVDVGANWGYFTLLAAPLVSPRGQVFAIEPDPHISLTLRSNVALNGFPHVTPLELAVADRNGTLPLLRFDPASGNYGLSRLMPTPARQTSTFPVPVRTLDQVFTDLNLSKVSLLKMDVEGAEASALNGLRGSLQAGIVERLLLELHPRYLSEAGSSTKEVFETLTSEGFSGWALDHSSHATRRAAYAQRLNPREYLRPFRPEEVLDPWPHFLWTRSRDHPLDG